MVSYKMKNTIVNILKVSASNIVIMLSGILVGLLLPKIIGVTDYGHYRTFTLYTSYVGLFHFGFSDGIYLKYGGKNYEELNKENFRFYSRFIIGLELLISLIIFMVAVFAMSNEYRFIFSCVGMYLIVNNITSYYQIISQITGRFNELAVRNILQSLLTSVVLIFLWWIHQFNHVKVSYRVYTIASLVISGLLATWYIYTYKDIVFGKDNVSSFRKIPLALMMLGFPLTVSNLCSTLILTIDRQFVNILFSTEVYAIYAFAYNLLALVTTALNSISTVLYPTMKRFDNDKVKDSYTTLVMWILILVALCITVFFPLEWFINWFLPKYSDSLVFFRIILPGLIFSSAVTLIMHNYYKIANENVLFFKKTVIVLFVSIFTSWIAYLLFKTPESISISAIIVILFWYIYMERFFVKKYGVNPWRNLTYACGISIAFYIISSLHNWLIAMFVYVFILILLTICFYHKKFMGLSRRA